MNVAAELSGLKILWIFEVDSSLRMTRIADVLPHEQIRVKGWCYAR